MALLEFKEVSKSFGKKEVLKEISLSVKEGELFGLLGVSGGGKSTLFNILMGLVSKDKGKILLEGKDVDKDVNNLRKNTGFATQSNMIFDELNIRENSLYFGSLYGMKRKAIKERLAKLLDLLGLEGAEKTLVRNLSGGMKKRANLLISLIHEPLLLLLDEPTGGLDPILRGILWKYIREINKAGTTVLVASHLIDEIEENCDKVGIMKNGKIIALASPSQYRAHYGKKKPLQDVFEELMRDENI